MDVAAWRRETRVRLVEARVRMPPQTHQTASVIVEGLVEEVFRDLNPGIVSLYWPFKAEVDLRNLMGRLRAAGWQTALPVVVGPRQPMIFRLWTVESEMHDGVYQIPVPRSGELVQPDVVITPLVGFDEKGYRLGYGAAYFDITLAAMVRRPLGIGVGFELARLDTIHPLPTDVPMDIIVTEAGIQRLAPGRRGL